MDYSDINEHKFKSKRTVNTLDPIYAFRKEGEEKSNYYGPIEKSKPVTNYPYYYKPALNLKIDDIKGSNPGSLNYIKKFKGKDYELYSSDIPKTNAGSLKKGITTSRCLNPLLPEYALTSPLVALSSSSFVSFPLVSSLSQAESKAEIMLSYVP